MVNISNIKVYLRFIKRSEPYFFIAPAMLFLVILLIFPIFRVIQYSFFENSFTNPSSPWVGIQNYIQVITNTRFIQVIVNSLLLTTVSVALHLIIGIGLAVALNQPINPFFLTIIRIIFILPWLFTAAVVAISWQLLLTPLGIVNHLLSIVTNNKIIIDWLGNASIVMITLIVINAWRGYPFCMISILAGLQSIPKELYEAAHIDGANSIKAFIHITIPQLKPILLSIGLLDAIWTLNLFPLIWLTTGGGPNGATETIATFTYKLAFNNFQFGQASAMAVIAVIMTMFLTIFYLKYQKMN